MKNLNKHVWLMVDAGIYDSTYRCVHCAANHHQQDDAGDSRPILGCVSRDFEAIKLIGTGSRPVDVVDFNGSMGICGDDEGCVLITKEQAMKFFGLKEQL